MKEVFKTILKVLRRPRKGPKTHFTAEGCRFSDPEIPPRNLDFSTLRTLFLTPSEGSFWSDLGSLFGGFWRVGNDLPEGENSTPPQQNAHFLIRGILQKCSRQRPSRPPPRRPIGAVLGRLRSVWTEPCRGPKKWHPSAAKRLSGTRGPSKQISKSPPRCVQIPVQDTFQEEHNPVQN